MMNFVLNMIYYALTMMKFTFKTMKRVEEMMNSALTNDQIPVNHIMPGLTSPKLSSVQQCHGACGEFEYLYEDSSIEDKDSSPEK